MLTTHALLAPSVPTLLVDEGRGDWTETIEALAAAGDVLQADAPEAIVAVSSRWRAPGPFAVDAARRHRTRVDQPGWGVDARYDCPGHPALARAIVEQAQASGLRAVTSRWGVDSGIAIPLHFLSRDRRIPVVPASIGEQATREEHRAWGAAIRRALNAWPGRVAFVVGGAITFNEHAFNLRRELAESLEVEDRVRDAIGRGAWDTLATLEPRIAAKAQPESGLLHLEVMRGFLVVDQPGEVLAVETVPGISALLARFELPAAAPATT